MSRVILLSLWTLLVARVAWADGPDPISYQGRLTEALGAPVPDSTYTVTFAIHNSPTTALPLWSETRTVQTSQGLFTVDLGSASPIPDTALSDTAAYLEITVSGDVPLSPRTKLLSVPFARQADAVDGSGPVRLSATDVANGNEAVISLETIEIDPFARVKVKFHWDSRNPPSGNGVSETVELDVDSGYTRTMSLENTLTSIEVSEHAKAHGHLDFLKQVGDPATGETVSQHTLLTPDSLTETTTAQSSSGTSTGKRQHKPIVFTKEWNASNAAGSADMSSVLHVDSGLTETVEWVRPSLETTFHKSSGHYKDVIIVARKSGVSGDTDEEELQLETTDTTAAFHVSSVSADGDTARAAMSGHARKSCSLTMFNTDSNKRANLDLTAGLAGPSLVLTRNNATAGGPKDDGVVILDASLPSGAAMKMQSVVGNDTGTVETTALGMSLNEKFNSVSTTVKTKTESKTDTTGASLELSRSTATDSSGIELVVDAVAPQIALTKLVGGTKWKNIVLKRGLSDGGEISVSHVGAGVNSGVFLRSDAAVGGQLGINTSSPTLAFHLVGSGCYTGSFGACSDARFKIDVETLPNPLETLSRLRGVQYEWNRDLFSDRQFPEGPQVGLIAQEVEAVVPSVVVTDAEGYKSVDYSKLVALLIEVSKAQQEQLSSQAAQIAQLESDMRAWRTLVDDLTRIAETRAGNSFGMK